MGVDAQELSMIKDLSVRDPVPPSDKMPVQVIEVKPIEILYMPAAHGPCLTGIQKGWEINSLVHFELCVCRKAFMIPDIFAFSAEDSTCFGKSIIHFSIYCHILGEDTYEVGKLVHYLQCISLHCDSGVMLCCVWCWMAHDLHLLCTNGQAKHVTCRWELVHALLCCISKEKVMHRCYLHLSLSLHSS